MLNYKPRIYFYFSTILTFIFFLPFFLKGNIGSDWDSYALFGTFKNYEILKLYIPSRPPGFPMYELIVGLIITLSDLILVSKEQLLLLFQFCLTISFNFLIYCFFTRFKNDNFLIYLIIVFSPIYLISGFSVIDYFLGSFFGFLGIYLTMFKYEIKYFNFYVSIFLFISISTRLSNLIFLIVVLLYQSIYRKIYISSFKIFLITLFTSLFFYYLFYSNLFSFYQSEEIYSQWSDLICMLNLTNTDHTVIDRFGRFVLKQVPFLGTVGTILFIGNYLKFKIVLKKESFYIFLLFIFFQLSFLRLPTEEGHLIPAFVALMILLRHSKNRAVFIILISVILSNFIDLKFFEVDKVDSASNITFSIKVEKGFLLQDYELRNSIGEKKEFHYENSQITLYDAWSKGCPNK